MKKIRLVAFDAFRRIWVSFALFVRFCRNCRFGGAVPPSVYRRSSVAATFGIDISNKKPAHGLSSPCRLIGTSYAGHWQVLFSAKSTQKLSAAPFALKLVLKQLHLYRKGQGRFEWLYWLLLGLEILPSPTAYVIWAENLRFVLFFLAISSNLSWQIYTVSSFLLPNCKRGLQCPLRNWQWLFGKGLKFVKS